MSHSRRLVAVDWGTSTFRAALLADDGRVLEETTSAQGILNVAAGEFAHVLIANIRGWMCCAADLCLISGMAGSRQGWREAPYRACPAALGDIVSALTWPDDWSGPGRVALVPGLRCERGTQAGGSGLAIPDVLRGEETQVFGAMRLEGVADGVFLLPGTHSKWVTLRKGRIERFRTFMSGEFYALLRSHSILGRGLEPVDDAFRAKAFTAGVRDARAGSGLLSSAFGVRTLGLLDRMPAADLPSYLSGLVIGEELREQQPPAGTPVFLIASAELAVRYGAALAQWDVPVRDVGSQAAWAGLHAIGREIE